MGTGGAGGRGQRNRGSLPGRPSRPPPVLVASGPLHGAEQVTGYGAQNPHGRGHLLVVVGKYDTTGKGVSDKTFRRWR